MDQILGMNIPDILRVLGLAASPISELRGAIPLAILEYDFHWYYAYIIAIIGNILPVPFILLLLNKITEILDKVPFFKKILDWFYARTRRRGRLIEKYQRIGLVLFVAIPLPITGAWTGAIAAVLMGIPFTKALLSISLGILIAGVIVTCLTLLGWVGAVIAGVCLILLVTFGMWKI